VWNVSAVLFLMPVTGPLAQAVQLRPIQPEDRAFLYRVYGSARAAEMDLLDWDDAQKRSFLTMQFNAQHQYYASQFPDAHFDILELNNEAIGRLYTDRRQHEIHIIDITLLPECRGQGIGSALLQTLLDEAASTDKCVSIHVEQLNPAMRLYERLGFRLVQDGGIYKQMEWCPTYSRP
jgi:ribosomal protein S18 acetylase RimI-like enzyme